MSLAACIESWCAQFMNQCTERANNIIKIKKFSRDIVNRHNTYRREVISARCRKNRNRTLDLVGGYFKDRSEAGKILASMREKL